MIGVEDAQVDPAIDIIRRKVHSRSQGAESGAAVQTVGTTVFVLDLEGYEVHAAANGQEALQEVARACPDLVVLDMEMPVIDGWALRASCRSAVSSSRFWW